MENLPFDNWKSRCSSLGNIMTNLPDFSIKDRARLEALNSRFNDVSAKALTDKMLEERWTLIEKSKLKDELPTGAKSFLDTVYNEFIYNRYQIIETDAMKKGTYEEDDALHLVSEYDRSFYVKNKETLSKDFIVGTPDNVQGKIRDTKCSFDFFSFHKIKNICANYKWQIKAYCWLWNFKEGEVIYCLVNTSAELINKLKYNLFYKLGAPSENDDDLFAYNKYLEGCKQIELAHIFDIKKFTNNLNGEFFDFDNVDWSYDIPIALRVKKFPVSLEDGDIEHIIRRVQMARTYLNTKYLEEQEIIKNWENGKI